MARSRPGTVTRLAADRHARAAAASDRARGHRLAAVRGADARCSSPRPDRVRPQVRAALGAGWRSSPRRSCCSCGVLRRRGGSGGVAAASGAGARGQRARVERGLLDPAALRVAVGPDELHRRPARGEYEILDGGRILGRGREPRRRASSGHFSLTLQTGRVHAPLLGRQDADGHAGRDRRARRGTARPSAGVAVLPPLPGARDGACSSRARTPSRRRCAAGDVDAGARRCSRRRARRTRRSSRSPSPSATSTRAIDARVNDVAQARSGRASTAIEKPLWVQQHDARDGARSPTGSWPTSRDLQALVKTVKLEPAQIANGATELLGEVSKSKMTGEEDRYSHTDLSDFEANVEGARGGVRRHPAARSPSATPRSATQIEGRFTTVDGALAAHREGRRLRRLRRRWTAARHARALPGRRRARRAAVAGRAAARALAGLADAAPGARLLRGAGARRAALARRRSRYGVETRDARRRRRRPSPFHGAHQAGIATPAQDRLHFARLRPRHDRRATLRDAAARTGRGRGRADDRGRRRRGPSTPTPLAPPDDTGEALGLDRRRG